MANQEREYRREHSAKVVAKPHTGATNVRRIQLVEQRTKARRNARREEAERETEKQHLRVGQRQKHIALHGDDTAQREQHDVFATANTVDQGAADHTPTPESKDDYRQLAAGIQHGQIAFGFEERWQPGHHRVVTAVGAQA